MRNRLNSEVKTFFKNGLIESKGKRVNGKLNGLYEEFYENGNPKHRGNYIKNIPEGLHENFYPNGQHESRGEYINGIRQGFWQVFKENGELIWSGQIQDHFYENGSIKAVGNYKDSKKDGLWEYYYDESVKNDYINEHRLVDQKKYGLKSSGYYVNGKKEGSWKIVYTDQGYSIRLYKNDLCNGIEERFNANGQLEIVTSWKDGKSHGKHQEFIPEDGIWECWYQFIEGKHGDQQYSIDRDAEYEKWKYDVSLWSHGTYINGNKEGRWYVNGEIEQYVNGKLIQTFQADDKNISLVDDHRDELLDADDSKNNKSDCVFPF